MGTGLPTCAVGSNNIFFFVSSKYFCTGIWNGRISDSIKNVNPFKDSGRRIMTVLTMV